MRTIERICNQVRNNIDANSKVDFYVMDNTLNGLLSEASKITTEKGKMVLFFSEEEVIIKYEICCRTYTNPPSFARIVAFCGRDLNYSWKYPSYQGTIL